MRINEDNRYSLKDPQNFLKEIKDKKRLTWKDLAFKLALSGSQIKKIRKGTRTIRGGILLELIRLNLTNKTKLKSIIVKERDPNWGQIKGGKITYNKIIEKYGKEEIRKRQCNGGRKRSIKHKYFLSNYVKNLNKKELEEIKKKAIKSLKNYSYKSSTGIPVRNRLELRTIENLISNRINFIYEPPLSFKNHLFFPDFLLRIKNKRILLECTSNTWNKKIFGLKEELNLLNKIKDINKIIIITSEKNNRLVSRVIRKTRKVKIITLDKVEKLKRLLNKISWIRPQIDLTNNINSNKLNWQEISRPENRKNWNSILCGVGFNLDDIRKIREINDSKAQIIEAIRLSQKTLGIVRYHLTSVIIGKYINNTLERHFNSFSTLIKEYGPVAQLGNK